MTHRPARHFHIVEEDGIRRLFFDRTQQSSMRLDDPYESDLPIASYLHMPLAVKPDSTRALLIGLGGGSVAKRMWRDYPQMQIDTVEIEQGVIQAAYEAFDLPRDERLNVIHGDGREFIESSEDTYDLIAIDAFDDELVPRPLVTAEFMQACRERLSPDGAIIYNLFGAMEGIRSKPMRSFFNTMSSVWENAWIFRLAALHDDSSRVGNTMALATDAPLTTEQLLASIASRADGLISVPGFELFADDLYTHEIDLDDAPIAHDPRLDMW